MELFIDNSVVYVLPKKEIRLKTSDSNRIDVIMNKKENRYITLDEYYNNQTKPKYEYHAIHNDNGPAIIDKISNSTFWVWRGYYFPKFKDWLYFSEATVEEKVLMKLRYG